MTPHPGPVVSVPPWLCLASPHCRQPLCQHGGCLSWFLFPPPGSAPGLTPGCGAGGSVPLAPWQHQAERCRRLCWVAEIPGTGALGVPGAGCTPAVAGAGRGCFPLCLLGPGDGQRRGSRPASFGQPIVSQLGGEGEGQPPQSFPNPGEGHHASAAQVEIAPGLVHPNRRLDDASRDPGVPTDTQHLALPSCPLVGAGTPHPPTGLGDMAASVLSASTSFCAFLAESFSLMGHERAFIPSPPYGWITPDRSLWWTVWPWD